MNIVLDVAGVRYGNLKGENMNNCEKCKKGEARFCGKKCEFAHYRAKAEENRLKKVDEQKVLDRWLMGHPCPMVNQ